MSDQTKPILLLHQADLEQARAAGIYEVYSREKVSQFVNKSVQNDVPEATYRAQLEQLEPCLMILPGEGEVPCPMYVRPLQPLSDAVEKGILSDVFGPYGEAKNIIVEKKGTEIKAQISLLQPQMEAEAAVLRTSMSTLQTTIGVAPPARDTTQLKGYTSGDYIDVPTYPWKETYWSENSDGRDLSFEEPAVAFGGATSEAVATTDRAPKSKEDAQNRDAYNDLAYRLRENLRDQQTARRLQAALPGEATYKLPLSILMALRFGDTAPTEVTG